MLLIHNGKIHTIKKADGPERIEQEWWITEGLHRDYYYVEDETGNRYWLFRSGHYDSGLPVGWFTWLLCLIFKMVLFLLIENGVYRITGYNEF